MKLAGVERRIDNLLAAGNISGLKMNCQDRLLETGALVKNRVDLIISGSKNPKDDDVKKKLAKNKFRLSTLSAGDCGNPVEELQKVKELYTHNIAAGITYGEERSIKEFAKGLKAPVSNEQVANYRMLGNKVEIYGAALKMMSGKKQVEIVKGFLANCRELRTKYLKYFQSSKAGKVLIESGILD